MNDGFAIRFLEPFGGVRFRGQLRLGHALEAFEADGSYWARADYEAQWRLALRSIMRAERTALVTSIADPVSANFIRWWPAYRSGRTVFFQEQVLFLDGLGESFRLERLDRYVGERVRTSENGADVSEWVVSVDAIERFLSED